MSGGANARYAAGHVIYLSGSSLVAAPFDPERAELTGDPLTIVDSLSVSRYVGAAQFALSGDGSRLIAGGEFTSLGGVMRSRLAAVDPASGAVEASFGSGADGTVWALVTGPDGRVFAGGDFTRIAGTAQAHLAALTADGASDPAWRAGADGRVEALALSSDGSRLYAGGAFTQAGGAARDRLAALSTAGAGAVDPGWDPGSGGHLPGGEVRAVALSPASTPAAVTTTRTRPCSVPPAGCWWPSTPPPAPSTPASTPARRRPSTPWPPRPVPSTPAASSPA